jgi:hypothetical protein
MDSKKRGIGAIEGVVAADAAAGTGSTVANAAETENSKMPQKKFYRSRAHCNPVSSLFEYD